MSKLLPIFAALTVLSAILLPLTSVNASIFRIKVYPENANPKQIIVRYGNVIESDPLNYQYTFTYTVRDTDVSPFIIEIEDVEGGKDYYCVVQDVYSDGSKSSISEASMAIPVPDDCNFELIEKP